MAQKLPNAALSLLFAAVLGYVSVRTLRRSRNCSSKAAITFLPATPCQLDDFSGRLIWDLHCARSLALTGIAAGFLSGLLGVGGGFIVVPALQKATHLAMQTIVPTSLAVIALVSAAGAFSAALAGSMNWSIALPFAAGAVVAMLMVGRFADYFTSLALRQGFAILAGCVSIGMIVSQLQKLL